MREGVLIVGGGIIGLGIGWQLSKAGRPVTLFDAGTAGRGASWAAAGQLAGRLQTGHPSDPMTRFLHRSQQLWLELVPELEEASGIAVGLRKEGTLLLAASAEEAQRYARLPHSWHGHEGGWRWIEREHLFELERHLSRDFHGALHSRFDYQVDNRAVAEALRLAFIKAGGTLRENEPVRQVIVEAGAVRGIETERGRVAAPIVILAAGAWSGGAGAPLVPGLSVPVEPVRGQMLAVATPPERPLLNHVVWAHGGYLVPRLNGRLVVGATTEHGGFDDRHTLEGLATLVSLVARTVPDALSLPIQESWVGFRPGTPDHLPILGPSGITGLLLATGHGHNGILMAAATIEALCVHILTGELDPAMHAFRLDRFRRRS